MQRGKGLGYLGLGLLAFAAFPLEYAVIFLVEKLLLGVDIWHVTPAQRSVHCLLMAGVWALVVWTMLSATRKWDHFPEKGSQTGPITAKNWFFALLWLVPCKLMTFIDWHTLKVIGEARGKTPLQFAAQYGYYALEVGLVLLILVYGQKAAETLLGRASPVPFGGILLALTWGAFHFVSRGVGLEVWNGLSCMLFSVFSGLLYLSMQRKLSFSYLLIAVGYLL